MGGKIAAEHGVICAFEGDFFGYFGWPSVARGGDGTLYVVASGLRSAHICPFGRTVLCVSRDEGRTWESPRVVNDTPLDDRDAGVLALGGSRLLAAWFTSDTREYRDEEFVAGLDPAARPHWEQGMRRLSPQAVERWLGSWVRLSEDGGETWGESIRAPVTAPHGPVRLRGGDLFYLGKERSSGLSGLAPNGAAAFRSADGGRTWRPAGTVPMIEATGPGNYHEPHAAELPSGRLLGMIRVQSAGPDGDVARAGLISFSIAQTESDDGGATWSTPHTLGFHGSPPHLLRHSSGALILSYGYRLSPYGQRVAISRDEGATWGHDFVLRDDGPSADLGYPASVELAGGDVLTVYYQQVAAGHKCALLCSRWRP